MAKFLSLLHLAENLFGDKKIQLIDQTGIFQNGNELPRGQEPFFGIDPARQGLVITNPAVGCPYDRLIIDLDPVLSDRTVKILYDVTMKLRFLEHLVAEIAVSGGVARSVSVTGHLGPVTGDADPDILCADLVDSDPDREVLPLVDRPALGDHFVELVFQAFRFVIRSEPVATDTTAILNGKGPYQDP